jgi:hypothetical protein
MMVLQQFIDRYKPDGAVRVGTIESSDYAFAPALRLGGSPSPKHIITCDAKVHLDILLQLALGMSPE